MAPEAQTNSQASAEGQLKRCSQCGRQRPHSDFHKRALSHDGLQPLCKDCASIKGRRFRDRYAAEHPPPPKRRKRRKRCYRCREEKPLASFAWNRTKLDGHADHCRACVRELGKGRTEEDRRNRVLRKVGLTIQDFEEMLDAQGGGCAICGATESGDRWNRALHIDHCHADGHVRGLLCMMCNLMLGKAKDDPAILRAAAEYLERHRKD